MFDRQRLTKNNFLTTTSTVCNFYFRRRLSTASLQSPQLSSSAVPRHLVSPTPPPLPLHIPTTPLSTPAGGLIRSYSARQAYPPAAAPPNPSRPNDPSRSRRLQMMSRQYAVVCGDPDPTLMMTSSPHPGLTRSRTCPPVHENSPDVQTGSDEIEDDENVAFPEVAADATEPTGNGNSGNHMTSSSSSSALTTVSDVDFINAVDQDEDDDLVFCRLEIAVRLLKAGVPIHFWPTLTTA